MTTDRPAEYLVSLVRELCKLPQETEWVEFEVNDAEPQAIGEYLSALANSTALAGKAFAYLVWGVSDASHIVVGTRFLPRAAKVGNEELESWLLRSLAPKIHFRFFDAVVDELPVVLLEIERAFRQPVQFQGHEFIRVGSYKKRLKDFPEKERALWRLFDKAPFESGVAVERVPDEEVLRLLDYPAYFDLMERPLPENRAGILAALEDDQLIVSCEAGGWNITNLGAILFAKRLDDFAVLKRKAMRVIQYRGNSRIEITNPGEPLVDTQRFVDTPPKSRNDGIASLMRRFRICEERGSGIDKVIRLVEAFQLPAPIFEVPDGFTRTVLFAHRPLTQMDKADRIRAVYQHACLRYVNRGQLTNSSVRERFGIEPANKAVASRLIRDALEAGVIRLVNEDVGDKLRAYVPHWA